MVYQGFSLLTANPQLLANAEVNAVANNATRVQPLHSAAAQRSVAIVRMLLDAGANVHAKQEGGYTALDAAVMHKDDELISVLRG